MEYSRDTEIWHEQLDYPHDIYCRYDDQVNILVYREFSEDGNSWFWGRKPKTTKFFRDRPANQMTGVVQDIKYDENPFTD